MSHGISSRLKGWERDLAPGVVDGLQHNDHAIARCLLRVTRIARVFPVMLEASTFTWSDRVPSFRRD